MRSRMGLVGGCKLGVLVSVGAATCLSTSPPFLEWRVGPGDYRSHRNSAVVTRQFGSWGLSDCGQYALVAQRLVHVTAHPQSLKQYGQLPRHRHHGSLLGILATALGQPQPPASQITVGSKGAKNVVRTLHHHRS